MSKIVRSNVYVKANPFGGVYEITDDPNLMRVMLEQTVVWWEGDRLRREVRKVEHFTNSALFKKGTILPGNICIAFQIEPILPEDPEEFMHYDKDGYISKTPEGFPIYTYYYYAPLSKYTADKALDEDDILEYLTTPSPI